MLGSVDFRLPRTVDIQARPTNSSEFDLDWRPIPADASVLSVVTQGNSNRWPTFYLFYGFEQPKGQEVKYYNSVQDIHQIIDVNNICFSAGLSNSYITFNGAVCYANNFTSAFSSTSAWSSSYLLGENLLSTLYLSSPQLKDKELSNILAHVNTLLSGQKFEVVDQLLAQIDITRVSLEVMIALLRVTFSAHDLLGQWSPFLGKAYDDISRRGREPEKMLRGLLPTS